MRCIICDKTDQWQNVDEHRTVAKGMSICGNCGFVSYPKLYKNEDEIKAYYRTNYRNIPKIGNLYTSQRKLNFHDAFLRPVFEEMKKKTDSPVIGEVGSAYGVFLNWIKHSYFPKAELYGTELTTTYRRVAFHEYSLNLTEDFNTSKKYDMICSYKVLEHQMDADLRLREYAECLKPDGLLYISVPTWFAAMTNFGLPGFDLEYYYDTNHINVWTKKLFETLLAKCGLEIVRHDGLMYDDTYLCKRNDALMDVKKIDRYEDVEKIKQIMKQMKEAFTLMALRGDPAGAIQAYPNYPDAWAVYYEKSRGDVHKQNLEVKVDEILKEYYVPFRAACGDCYETYRFGADICMRYEDYETSLKFWQKALETRPGAGYVLGPITHCFRRLAEMAQNPKDQMALRKKAVEITRHWTSTDLESRSEAINWLYFDLSKLEMPNEQVGQRG